MTHLFGIGILLSSPLAHAGEFFLGGGPQYGVLQATNATGTGDSYFPGFGLLGEARLRFMMAGSDDISWAVFFDYGQRWTQNSVESTETNSITQYSGGVDIEILKAFVGVEYRQQTSQVTYSGSTSTWNYTGIGGRLGGRIPIWERVDLVVGGTAVVSTGRTATSTAGTRASIDFVGYLMFQLRVF